MKPLLQKRVMSNSNRKPVPFFRGLSTILISAGLVTIILSWVDGRPLLGFSSISMLIGLSVGWATVWLYRDGYFGQPEIQSNLRLREIDPQATRPWKEGWKEISQLKEKE